MFRYLLITLLSVPAFSFASPESGSLLNELGVAAPSNNERVCQAMVGTSLQDARMIRNLPEQYCRHRSRFPTSNMQVIALGDFYRNSDRSNSQPVNNTSDSTTVVCRMRLTMAIPKKSFTILGVPAYTIREASTQNVYLDHVPEEACVPNAALSFLTDTGEVIQSVGQAIVYDYHLYEDETASVSP